MSLTSRWATGSAQPHAKQESWKFLGTLVSAATEAVSSLLLNKVYGFTGDNALIAPQANAMAKVIEPLMMGGDTPWILYMTGAILALILNWLGVPALASLSRHVHSLQLNTPLLVGGAIAWFVGSRSTDKALNDARRDRGTLISSGLIAGGALFRRVRRPDTLPRFRIHKPSQHHRHTMGRTCRLCPSYRLPDLGFDESETPQRLIGSAKFR